MLIKIFLLVISLIIIGLVQKDKNAKKSFIENIKMKTNDDLYQYITKSVKPIPISLENVLSNEEIKSLQGSFMKLGIYNDKYTIDEIRFHKESIFIFVNCQTYSFIGLINPNNNRFYNISGGKIRGENIAPELRNHLLAKINVQKIR